MMLSFATSYQRLEIDTSKIDRQILAGFFVLVENFRRHNQA